MILHTVQMMTILHESNSLEYIVQCATHLHRSDIGYIAVTRAHKNGEFYAQPSQIEAFRTFKRETKIGHK